MEITAIISGDSGSGIENADINVDVENPSGVWHRVPIESSGCVESVCALPKRTTQSSNELHVCNREIKCYYRGRYEVKEKISKPIALVSGIDVNVSRDSFSGNIKRFIQIRAKKVLKIIKEMNLSGISIHPNENLAAKALYNIYQFYNKSKEFSY